mgnify:FL=1
MPNITNLAGKRVGMLTVKHMIRKPDDTRRVYWVCQCACGEQTTWIAGNLMRYMRHNKSASCGCVFKTGDFNRIHSGSKRPEYRVWSAMRERCTNAKDPAYKHYGARGITLDPKWMTFAGFIEDMGWRPSGAHTIERVNNDGPYCKKNCVWATQDVQQRNRRDNLWLELGGVRMIATDWAKHTGIPRTTVSQRARRGLAVEDVLRGITPEMARTYAAAGLPMGCHGGGRTWDWIEKAALP